MMRSVSAMKLDVKEHVDARIVDGAHVGVLSRDSIQLTLLPLDLHLLEGLERRAPLDGRVVALVRLVAHSEAAVVAQRELERQSLLHVRSLVIVKIPHHVIHLDDDVGEEAVDLNLVEVGASGQQSPQMLERESSAELDVIKLAVVHSVGVARDALDHCMIERVDVDNVRLLRLGVAVVIARCSRREDGLCPSAQTVLTRSAKCGPVGFRGRFGYEKLR